MANELVVFVTVPSREEGERLADHLVSERLAACVNVIGPIHSIYRWEGGISRDEEHLLVIKTTQARYGALEARVHDLHSYQTPEVIALPIRGGARAYLAWVRRETKPGRGGRVREQGNVQGVKGKAQKRNAQK